MAAPPGTTRAEVLTPPQRAKAATCRLPARWLEVNEKASYEVVKKTGYRQHQYTGRRCQQRYKGTVDTIGRHIAAHDLRSLLERASYRFSREAAWRTLEQCFGRMTHEYGLSRVVCAGALAETDPQKLPEFVRQALATDQTPTSGSAHEGLHLGSHGGLLNVVLHHYAGVRYEKGAFSVDPAWPPGLPGVRMAFHVFNWRGPRFVAWGSAATVTVRSSGGNDQAIDVRLPDGVRRRADPGCGRLRGSAVLPGCGASPRTA